jgi:hypothetical protein
MLSEKKYKHHLYTVLIVGILSLLSVTYAEESTSPKWDVVKAPKDDSTTAEILDDYDTRDHSLGRIKAFIGGGIALIDFGTPSHVSHSPERLFLYGFTVYHSLTNDTLPITHNISASFYMSERFNASYSNSDETITTSEDQGMIYLTADYVYKKDLPFTAKWELGYMAGVGYGYALHFWENESEFHHGISLMAGVQIQRINMKQYFFGTFGIIYRLLPSAGSFDHALMFVI